MCFPNWHISRTSGLRLLCYTHQHWINTWISLERTAMLSWWTVYWTMPKFQFQTVLNKASIWVAQLERERSGPKNRVSGSGAVSGGHGKRWSVSGRSLSGNGAGLTKNIVERWAAILPLTIRSYALVVNVVSYTASSIATLDCVALHCIAFWVCVED